MKIGIVIGTIRENRVKLDVARWVKELTVEQDEAEFEIVDIKD